MHSRLSKFRQAGVDVAHLQFGVEDQAATVGQMRTRPVDYEKVRELRHGDPQIGERPTAPDAVQVGTVAAGDGHRPQHVGVPKPGGVDDDIDVMNFAVLGDDAVGGDFSDRRAYQVDVVAAQRAQPGAVVL